MKRHLPRVLSSFRSTKRRIPATIETNKTLPNTVSSHILSKTQRSRSAETIERKIEVVPLAEGEIVDEQPTTSTFVKKRPPPSNAYFWEFNKRFSTNYTSFRARKSAQVSSNCRVFKLVMFQSLCLLNI